MYTVAANFCLALPALSKLLTASWFLETLAATSLVSLSDQGPVQIILLVWNTQCELPLICSDCIMGRIVSGLFCPLKTLSSAASPANVTFFLLTVCILPPSGLLPNTTPEKHGKLMEWIHYSSGSFPGLSILFIPRSLWTLDMFLHFLKRLKTKAEAGCHMSIQPILPFPVVSAPPEINPFAFHFSSNCSRFRRGSRNRVWWLLNSLWLTVKIVQVTVKWTLEPYLCDSKPIQAFWNLCSVAG